MPRKARSVPQPPDEDDGRELLPVRGKIVVPAKNVKKRPPARKPPAKDEPIQKVFDDAFARVAARRRERMQAQEDDGTGDEIDAADMDGGAMTAPEMEGLPQHSRRTIELEAQMASRLHGAPVFPFPPELQPELRPYWQELVNSFPKDHFQVSDTTLMKMYCQCAYDIERQSIKIAEEGEVVIGGRGQAIVNPRCKVRESNRATLLSLATKFRNQPASRTNTDNFKGRHKKATAAANAVSAVMEDDDGLLAGPGDDTDDDQYTRH